MAPFDLINVISNSTTNVFFLNMFFDSIVFIDFNNLNFITAAKRGNC